MRAASFLNGGSNYQVPNYSELVELTLKAGYSYACTAGFQFIKIQVNHNGCRTESSICVINDVITVSTVTFHHETEKKVISQFYAYSNEECMEALKRLFSATVKTQNISLEKPYLAFSKVNTESIAQKFDKAATITIGKRPADDSDLKLNH